MPGIITSSTTQSGPGGRDGAQGGEAVVGVRTSCPSHLEHVVQQRAHGGVVVDDEDARHGSSWIGVGPVRGSVPAVIVAGRRAARHPSGWLAEQLAGPGDVTVHLRHQRLDAVEAQRVAQPRREGQPDVLAVEVEAGWRVEDVRLDAALAPAKVGLVPMLVAAGSCSPLARTSRPA